MIIRHVVSVTAIVVQLSVAAQAETWVQIVKNEHSTIYVDTDSGVRSQAHITFWVKYDFDASHPIGIYDGKPMTGPNLEGMTQFVQMRSNVEADCAANTFTKPLVQFYDASGTMVSSAIASLESKPITPNSIAAAAAQLMCK